MKIVILSTYIIIDVRTDHVIDNIVYCIGAIVTNAL